MTTLTIWHNSAKDERGRAAAMLAGYREGDRLVPVAAYDVEAPAGAPDLLALAQDAYRLFNVGDDPAFGAPDERALRYRAARNRSLSVGDVVQIGAIWLSVQAGGFAHLAGVPAGITLTPGRSVAARPSRCRPAGSPADAITPGLHRSRRGPRSPTTDPTVTVTGRRALVPRCRLAAAAHFRPRRVIPPS